MSNRRRRKPLRDEQVLSARGALYAVSFHPVGASGPAVGALAFSRPAFQRTLHLLQHRGDKRWQVTVERRRSRTARDRVMHTEVFPDPWAASARWAGLLDEIRSGDWSYLGLVGPRPAEIEAEPGRDPGAVEPQR